MQRGTGPSLARVGDVQITMAAILEKWSKIGCKGVGGEHEGSRGGSRSWRRCPSSGRDRWIRIEKRGSLEHFEICAMDDPIVHLLA